MSKLKISMGQSLSPLDITYDKFDLQIHFDAGKLEEIIKSEGVHEKAGELINAADTLCIHKRESYMYHMLNNFTDDDFDLFVKAVQKSGRFLWIRGAVEEASKSKFIGILGSPMENALAELNVERRDLIISISEKGHALILKKSECLEGWKDQNISDCDPCEYIEFDPKEAGVWTAVLVPFDEGVDIQLKEKLFSFTEEFVK